MDDLAQTYQKKTDKEHVLDNPDTYIGSIEEDEIKDWYLSNDNKFVFKSHRWVPGLYKCFDEGAVNARDHWVRLSEKKKVKHRVTKIDFNVDKETGIITIYNDGEGIDIEKHPEYNIWIPEMIFGHLRSSANYNKDEKKIVGGKNGFGFKLVLIYSSWGKIETVDSKRQKKYIQEFKNNLNEIGKPSISKYTGTPYTKVSFLLDFKRFGVEKLTDDMFQVLKKRAYDMAAVTDKSVTVRWNKKNIPLRTFEKYINMYIGTQSETSRIYEKYNARWEIAVCRSPLDEFTQVSFVNGINTGKGGKHIDYILNQIIRKTTACILKKKKVKVKPATIKEQLMLFVNCVIENPTFSSQTKDFMNLPIKKFGSKCEISNKFIEKLIKLGVMETALLTNNIKEQNASKKTDGRKTHIIRGIPKLVDANYAGGAKSSKCILILCEGDSAKAGIMSGLSKDDRNYFGVFPLKGKLLNARDASQKKINDNVEISNIKKILGLESGKKYLTKDEVKKSLRYGKVQLMTDQDLDGSHIKGLCINMFHTLWKDLIQIDSFLGFMNTPILKARKGKKELCFYNDAEAEKWKAQNNTKGWRLKYYKGLGTSTAKEFKEYFNKKKVICFKFGGEDCNQSIDKVFNKKRADDRKTWLSNYQKDAVLDTNAQQIRYEDFIDKEMIHYSKYDCERSIPNLMDGLKPSQRKIMFGAFKRNLIKEVKVAQLSGYISEHAAYHHGEMSLQKAIIGMAQEFLGANNIALLMPNGQFGTRLEGGKDSASPRYIFTQLNKLTKLIFNENDKCVLNYLDDDGTKIEPDYYAPIVPMILINGSEGIGTGFSSKILCYNPIDIMNYLRCILRKQTVRPELKPYYEGFKGTTKKIASHRWCFKGKYNIVNHMTVTVTDLPVGVWTNDFKQNLEKLMVSSKQKKEPIVKKYSDMSTDVVIDFKITLYPGVLHKLLSKTDDNGINEFEKKFKLVTTKTTSNQYLFDHNQQIKKYAKVSDIIDAYYPVRYELYVKRKAFMLEQLEKMIKILSNKARFIEEQCNNVIDLRRKKKQVVIQLLMAHNFDTLDGDFNYLTKMPIDSVIDENIKKLRDECEEKKKTFDKLKGTSIEKMWLRELKELRKKYEKYCLERVERQIGKKIKKKKKKT